MADTNDPMTASPRELMQAVLPPARRSYIRVWEMLADSATPREQRRTLRERVATIADEHAAVVEFLRAREAEWRGEDRKNGQHIVAELERHIVALGRLRSISAGALLDADELRPDKLGCGPRFRRPERRPESSASRDVPAKPTTRAPRQRDERTNSRPYSDRGPRVSKEQLGNGRHESALGDSLDPETRARLEALQREASTSAQETSDG